MLKVFLVEDESVVREGLRDNINWQQYGYQFAGEAGDGEMALPLIRKTRPDVLITDIKMPFMDGLALSRIVSQEFPQMKIVIISGYDDFEYARQAIQVGVEQYLLKPVTKFTLQKVLQEIAEKIEGERAQENYLEKFREEMQEYEQFSRRNFFEKVFERRFSVQQIYEEAQKLSLEMNAACYNLAMVSLWEKRPEKLSSGMPEKQPANGAERPTENLPERKGRETMGRDPGLLLRKQEELVRYFLRYPEFLVFRWNISTYGILMMGEEEQMEGLRSKCLNNVERICSDPEENLDWHCAVGEPVGRLSLLPDCYDRVNHMLSRRFLNPRQHILTAPLSEGALPDTEEGALGGVDIARADPEIIRGFLMRGEAEELEDFVDGYLESQRKALQSRLFRDYLMLSIRFTTLSFVETLGCSQEEFLSLLGTDKMQNLSLGAEDMKPYMLSLLGKAIELSGKEKDSQGKRIIKKALEYIDGNYMRESLSLNGAAGAADVSPGYFSALFSQEMEMTFTEYVTQKRMEKAKRLLRQTEKHTGEIAAEVGFKDPHYFSFVFKKTQGCSPREYRMGAKA